MSTKKTADSHLPTIAELHHDVNLAFKNDKLNLLLNQPPHEKWLKKHPIIKVKDSDGKNTALQYLPVDKVEFMIIRIFGQWKREILREGVMFNSVYAIVRLWVLNPVTGEWTFHDGGGACPVQTDAGESAANMSAIKSGAIQMALPAAISYALKDAAECLGKLFGKDLNKMNAMMFSTTFGDDKHTQPEEQPKKQPKQPEEPVKGPEDEDGFEY